MNKQKSDPPVVSPAAEPNKEVPDVAFELSLEDTLSQRQRGVPTKGTKVVSGYNPYDTPLVPAPLDPKAKEQELRRKPTDLRKLSEWIRLQRQVEALKKDPADSE